MIKKIRTLVLNLLLYFEPNPEEVKNHLSEKTTILSGICFFVGFALLALMCTGPLRAILRISLTSALYLSLPIFFILFLGFILFFPHQKKYPPLIVITAILGIAVVFGWSFYCLYNVYFDGLINLGGPDSGTHLSIVTEFATKDPSSYNGFIIFHTLMYWFKKFVSPDMFDGVQAIFYFIVFCISAVPFLVLAEIISDDPDLRGRKILVLFPLVLTLFSLYIFYRVILPVLHYHQGDGFFAHLFLFIPFLFIWVMYGTVRFRIIRISLLLTSVVIYRFSYGLNLGDYVLMIGALSIFEGLGCGKKWLKISFFSLGTVLFLGSIFIYYQLYPVSFLTGAIVEHRYVQSLFSSLGLTIVLWAVMTRHSLNPFRHLLTPAITRFVLFAVLFSLIGAVVQTLYLVFKLPIYYYFLKYGLHSTFVLIFTISAVFTYFFLKTGELAWKKRQFRPLLADKKRLALYLVAAFILVLSVDKTISSYKTHRHRFQERVWGKPSWDTLGPLSDRAGERVIRQWLKETHKRFGGLMIVNYGLSTFMNSNLGTTASDAVAYLHDGTTLPDPGTCFFWYDNDDRIAYMKIDKAVKKGYETVLGFRKDPGKSCRTFHPDYDHSETERLCAICL